MSMIIQDNVYLNKVTFLHGDRETVIEEMRTLGVPEENLPSAREEGCIVEAEKCFILWVRDSKNYPVLVHEIYHLVEEVFKYMGIDGDYFGEFGANLAEFYMREICKHLRTATTDRLGG
jgi:hypothetical protein